MTADRSAPVRPTLAERAPSAAASGFADLLGGAHAATAKPSGQRPGAYAASSRSVPAALAPAAPSGAVAASARAAALAPATPAPAEPATPAQPVRTGAVAASARTATPAAPTVHAPAAAAERARGGGLLGLDEEFGLHVTEVLVADGVAGVPEAAAETPADAPSGAAIPQPIV